MKVYDFKGNVIFDDPLLQDKVVTENGTYQADNGYDGLGSVTVEVASKEENGYVSTVTDDTSYIDEFLVEICEVFKILEITTDTVG